MKNLRNGVSLIAVLLFMLVATIAGTATYKWLTSEGFSSASRLLVNEARAASMAGVDAARSWMNTHGNETGAIIKQFVDIGKPISLNSVLAPMAKESQQFDVYLVGVEFSPANPVYKLKIVSKGSVRGRDVSYTESAVLNVTGLYQVRIPVEERALNYNYAYFGGSTSYAGEHHVDAMLINGNWGVGQNVNGANPGYVAADFIVTGHARLSGDKMNVGGTACIGGDLVADNGFWGTDLFVGKNAKHGHGGNNDFVAQIAGSAYFNGDVKIGNQDKPGFDVTGNVTLNGTMETNLNSFGHFIHGNLCLGQDAKINLGDGGNSWRVDNNIWIPASVKNTHPSGPVGIITSGNSNEHKRVFGGRTSSKLYIKDAEACTGSCPDTLKPTKQKHSGHNAATFRTNGDVYLNLPNKIPFECAESVKTHCDEIWHKTKADEEKCDGAEYKVNDLLKTGHKQFEPFAGKAANSSVGDCSGIDKISPANVTKMNSCWRKLMDTASLRSTYLYNDYLVLKLTYDEGAATEADKAGATQLNGNFLFIYDNAITANHVHFPRTKPNARVFVYLKGGAPSTNSHLNCATEDTYNYFIFTKANIGGMLGSCTWKGSVYATATHCAAIPDINGSVTLQYDANLVNHMATSGIICANDNNPDNPCPVGVNPDSANADTANHQFDPALFDDSHIATGTNLNVTVESEYKSDEKVGKDVTEIQPSIMVLPRVVYINRDAPGTMMDYLSVVTMNGTGSLQGTSELTCPGQPGAPPMTGKIKNGPVVQGIYNCTYKLISSNKALTSNFYVKVAGDAASTPMVHFQGDPSQDFNPGQSNDAILSVVVGPSETGEEVHVSVSMTDEPSGWTVTNVNNTPVQWKIGADGARYIQLTLNPSSDQETTIPVFRVRTENNALSGTLRFAMHSPQGCIIGGGTVVKSFNILGKITVHRRGLKEFCVRYPDICLDKPEYNVAKDIQDCDSSTVWVSAYGVGCKPEPGAENRQWSCDANIGAANEIQLIKGEYDKVLCEAYIPTSAEHNVIVDPKSDNMNPGGDTLYASLKRKFYRLTIKTQNAEPGEYVHVDTSNTFGVNYVSAGQNCSSSEGCTYIVYAGQAVKLTPVPQDGFARWEGEEPYFVDDQNNLSSLEFTMGQDMVYTAVFHEKDQHCFYTDFSEYGSDAIWCPPDEIECVDYCAHSASCDIEGGVRTNTSWIEVNSNGTNAKPELYGGYIKHSGVEAAMIMNTVEAGPNGEFSARVRTGIAANQSNTTDYLNSAIIVRAKKDASEYISVNFFGSNSSGSDASDATETRVRVCYSNTLVKTDLDRCGEVTLTAVPPTTLNGFKWSAGTQLNTSTIVRGDSLHVKVSYVTSTSLKQLKGSIDLRPIVNNNDYTLNDDEHSYVGIKLKDNAFGVYDASWTSDLYADDCFANPSVFCSFATKYLGGEVPINENVTPAIGYSKWFLNQGQNCSSRLKFYYNGCDLASSSYENNLGMSMFANWTYCKNNVCGEGMISNAFSPSGLELKASSDFNFSCEGKHGFEHVNPKGYVRNASVEVDCRGVNGNVYTAKCGEFYVGRKHGCRQDEHLVTSSENHGIEEVTIDIPREDGVNLRDANIMFAITHGVGVSIRARLVDVNGSLSDEVSWSQDGPHAISYEEFSDRYGFNPEKVKKIKIRGTGSYTIDSIVSHCTHTLKVYCGQNDAVYSGDHWRITASIDPLDEAKKCRVVANKDGDKIQSYFDLCNTGVFNLPDPEFMDRMNIDSITTAYDFTVSVYDDINATELTEPVSQCVAESQGYDPVVANCHLLGTKTVFPQGTGVPAVSYEALNCPENGCEYELSLENAATYSHSDRISGEKTWSAGLNTASALSPGSYRYIFKLLSGDKSKVYATCQTETFSVVPAKPATASNCMVVDGHFSAYVEGSNYEEVNAVLVQSDAQGNVLGSQTVAVDANSSLDFDLSSLSNGYYTLVLNLNGVQACPGVSYVVGGPQLPELTATCPTTPFTGYEPGASIVFSPTVGGCNGDCSWKIFDGSNQINYGTYNSTSLSFNDVNGSGTKTYNFRVVRQVDEQKDSANCNVTVTYKSALTLTTCPSDVTDQDPSSTIALSPSVGGCGSCSWKVLLGNVQKGSGQSLNSVSFKDENGTGSNTYTFRVVRQEAGQKDSTECNFNVTFASAGGTVDDWQNNVSLSAGTYTISKCKGATGSLHTQIKANFVNCWDAFSAKSNSGYWNNRPEQCDGEAVVSFPVTLTVPAGKTVTLSNCWK